MIFLSANFDTLRIYPLYNLLGYLIHCHGNGPLKNHRLYRGGLDSSPPTMRTRKITFCDLTALQIKSIPHKGLYCEYL